MRRPRFPRGITVETTHILPNPLMRPTSCRYWIQLIERIKPECRDRVKGKALTGLELSEFPSMNNSENTEMWSLTTITLV